MSKQTRREFIENSLLASAAAAASGSLAVQSSLAAGKPSRSPNERIRVAVLGVRGRGQAHLSAFMSRDDVEVVAVVDPDELIGREKGVKTVEKVTKKKPAFFQDMRKVMEDTSIDVVSIATPNHWQTLRNKCTGQRSMELPGSCRAIAAAAEAKACRNDDMQTQTIQIT